MKIADHNGLLHIQHNGPMGYGWVYLDPKAEDELLGALLERKKGCSIGEPCSLCRHGLSLEFNRGEQFGYDRGWKEAQEQCPMSSEPSPAWQAGYDHGCRTTRLNYES